MAGRYYSKFVPNFAVVALLSYNLVKKRAPNKVEWEHQEEMAFRNLKSVLCKKPILQMQDASQPLIFRTDANAGEGC